MPLRARRQEFQLDQQVPVPAKTVWDGKIGPTSLRVGVLPSGRIEASWRGKSGADRRVVVNSVEELERSVLFQLMINATPEEAGVSGDIAQKVAQAKVGLPDPSDNPRPKTKKKRRGGPPRRRFGR